MTDVVAQGGVLGGSGLHALLEDARTVEVATPYGAPSARWSSARGWSVTVTHTEVLRVLRGSRARLRALLLDVAAGPPPSQDGCGCATALDGLTPDPAHP